MAASTIALRRAAAAAPASMFSKLHNPFRSASVVGSSVSRSFNTDAQSTNTAGHDLGTVDVRRRSSSDRGGARRRLRRESPPPTAFISDWIDPFSPTRTLGQVFNLMDQLMDPWISSSRGLGGTGGAFSRRGWDAKEDDQALYLRMDMPGLGKEDVKVWVESDTLVIEGEGGKAGFEEEKEGEGGKYSSRIQLPTNLYNLDEIKGEMKNGVLRLVVPKVKEEERQEVREVRVE